MEMTKMNLEMIKLIWIDQMANSTEENREFQRKFRDEFHYFELIEKEENLRKFLEEKKDLDEMIILIVSGRLAQSILNEFHSNDSILFIFIFCGNKSNFSSNQFQSFDKLKGIHDDIEDLLDNLYYRSRSIEYQLQCRLELINSNEFYLSKLTSIPFNCFDRRILLDFLYFHYESNPKMIERISDFEHFYEKKNSLEIFLKQKLLYRILFKSLLTMKIDRIYLFRFYFDDFHDEIKDLESISTTNVYRIHLLRKDQIDLLYKFKEKQIEFHFNQILFVHQNKEFLEEILRHSSMKKDFHRVLFQIEPNENIRRSEQFSFISLFNSFRISSIDKSDQYFLVHLFITSTSTTTTTNSIPSNRMKPIEFVHYLRDKGHFDQCEILLNHLIERNPRHLSIYFDALARLYQDKELFQQSRFYYYQSFDSLNESPPTTMKTKEKKHFEFHLLNNLGTIHFHLKEFDQSLEFYQKSLLKTSDETYRSISLNNLAIVFFELNQFDRSFEYFRQAEQIEKKYFNENRIHSGVVALNLAKYYSSIKENDSALIYFEKSLKIFSTKQRNKYRALLFFHLAQFYQNNSQFDRSIQFYLEAKQIWKKYPKEIFSSNLRFIDQQIQQIKSQPLTNF